MNSSKRILIRAPLKGPRKYSLEFNPSGLWFFSYTLIVALVTFTTDNNVLFLLTSFLVSAVFLSSLFSDFALYRTQITRKTKSLFAKDPKSKDMWTIENKSYFPLFSVELGEYDKGNYTPLDKIPYIGPRKKISFESPYFAKQRGLHQWESIYIATEAPFGFTKKYHHKIESSTRFIWPARKLNTKILALLSPKNSTPTDLELDFSRLEQGHLGDDLRKIHPLKTTADLSEIYLRSFDQQKENTRTFEFSLAGLKSEEFETALETLSVILSRKTILKGSKLSLDGVVFPHVIQLLNHLSQVTQNSSEKVAS
jgi:hypothetical protein